MSRKPGTPRGRQRDCTKCGRSFHGETHRCHRCRATQRTCKDCGVAFMGNQDQCSACLRTGHTCVQCAATFNGNTRLCGTCRTIPRTCIRCGEGFTGQQQPCQSCRRVERACAGCGCTIRAATFLCWQCRATERTCEGCGIPFRGTHLRCGGCSAVERDCVDCGRRYRGASSQCVGCWRASLPPGVWGARQRAYGNERRARKLVAEVAGPVPAEVYAQVLVSGPCVYCGEDATEVDHVRPLARGGWEHESNLVPACRRCNGSKGNRLLIEWRPGRVAYGVAHSAKVAEEYARQIEWDTGGELS